MAFLEICCFNAAAAVLAAQAGADRIELCADREVGGTTPPLEWLHEVKKQTTSPIFVMVRPRGGNFTYSDAEFDEMMDTIRRYKADADGFVLGVLHNGTRQVDEARTRRLVQHARPLPCTFHRAIDETPDVVEALRSIIATGCTSVLSSGAEETAVLGASNLRTLVETAKGKIHIMPGGGVRSENIEALQRSTGATFFHSSAAVPGSALPDVDEIKRIKASIMATSIQE